LQKNMRESTPPGAGLSRRRLVPQLLPMNCTTERTAQHSSMGCRCKTFDCQRGCGCRGIDRPCYLNCGCAGTCTNGERYRTEQLLRSQVANQALAENALLREQLAATEVRAAEALLSVPSLSTLVSLYPAPSATVISSGSSSSLIASTIPSTQQLVFGPVHPMQMPDTPQHRFWRSFAQAWTHAVRMDPNPMTQLLHPQVRSVVQFIGSSCGTNLRRESPAPGGVDSRMFFCNQFTVRPLSDISMREFQSCNLLQSPPTLDYQGPCGIAIGATVGSYRIVATFVPVEGSLLVDNVTMQFTFPVIPM